MTDVLRDTGVLASGRVSTVQVESVRPTILSQIIRLRLSYSGDVNGAPTSLILKTAHPDRKTKGWEAGQQEVSFYRDVAGATPSGLLPRCFEAYANSDSKSWHLLLEDLTDTHTAPTAWPLPPSQTQCERIIDARARFQAAWWDEPRLGVTVGKRRDAAAVERTMQGFASHFAHVADRLGDDMSPSTRALYEQLQGATGLLIKRLESCRNSHDHAWRRACLELLDAARWW